VYNIDPPCKGSITALLLVSLGVAAVVAALAATASVSGSSIVEESVADASSVDEGWVITESVVLTVDGSVVGIGASDPQAHRNAMQNTEIIAKAFFNIAAPLQIYIP